MTEINTRKRDIKSLIANKQTTIENELDSLIVKVKRLTKERDEARKNVLGLMHPDSRHGYITAMEWDCFNTPEAKVDKTLNGVIVYGGKAVPPKYEDLGDE
ncbi:MAG: hypothetical protein H7831_10895 [Magnetococcus sp. WYHC-3]